MDREKTQPVTPGSVSHQERWLPQQRVTRSDEVTAAAGLAEQLLRLRSAGWHILHDVVRPMPDAEPVSMVAVGPGGIVVLETSTGFTGTRRAPFLAAAGALAATLPTAQRHRVWSVLVLMGEPEDARAAGVAPATIDLLPVDSLAEDLLAHSSSTTNSDDAPPAADIAAGIVATWAGRRGRLVTTGELPPADHCVAEAALRARRPGRLRRLRRPDLTTGGPRRETSRPVEPATLREEFNLTDMLRIVLVGFAVAVGLWFLTVVSDTVGPTAGESARRSPVISSQPSGSSQTDVVVPAGNPEVGDDSASR